MYFAQGWKNLDFKEIFKVFFQVFGLLNIFKVS